MKVMKKTLAVLLSALMIMSLNAGIIFADGETTYPSGEEITLTISNLTDPSYYVTGSATKTWSGPEATLNQEYALYSIPLPELEANQTISNFKFTYTITGANHKLHDVINIPGKIDPSTITKAELAAQKAIASNFVGTGEQANKGGNITNTVNNVYGEATGATAAAGTRAIAYTADITDYAVKAYATNCDHVYIAIFGRNYTVKAFSTNPYAAHATLGVVPTYSFTLGAVENLNLMSSYPANDATDVSIEEDAVFTFNNPISSATAYVNGEEAEITISGVEVIVHVAPMFELADYNITVDAIDGYGQTCSASTEFSTDAVISVKGAANGTAYLVSANADPARTLIANMNCKYEANQLGIFKLPVPAVDEGYELAEFIFEPFNGWSQPIYALKFAGEDWIMQSDEAAGITAMRFGDENVAPIVDDWAANLDGSKYIASKSITYNGHRTYIDITSYMNECIKNGQDYCYVGIISLATTQIYGFRDGNNDSSKMSYRISYACEIEPAMIVAADTQNYASANHVSKLANGESYKVVVPYVNYKTNNVNIKVVLAQYNSANKLVGINYCDNVELIADTFEDGYAVIDAMTIDGECDNVKALVWDAGTLKPINLPVISVVE